jgi:hypothetical protein
MVKLNDPGALKRRKYRLVQLGGRGGCKLDADHEHFLGGPWAGHKTNCASCHGKVCGISCLYITGGYHTQKTLNIIRIMGPVCVSTACYQRQCTSSCSLSQRQVLLTARKCDAMIAMLTQPLNDSCISDSSNSALALFWFLRKEQGLYKCKRYV